MAESELDGMNSVMLDFLLENRDRFGPAFAAFLQQDPTAMVAMVDAAKVARPWRIGKGLLGGNEVGAHRQAVANNGVLLRVMQGRSDGQWYAFGHADRKDKRASVVLREQDVKLKTQGYGLADQPCEACTRAAPIAWDHPCTQHNGKVTCFLEPDLVFVHPGVCFFAWLEKKRLQKEQASMHRLGSTELPARARSRTIVGSTGNDNGEFRRVYDHIIRTPEEVGRDLDERARRYVQEQLFYGAAGRPNRSLVASVPPDQGQFRAVYDRVIQGPLPADAGSFAEVAQRAAVPIPPPLAQRMAFVGVDTGRGPDALSITMVNSNPQATYTEIAAWPRSVTMEEVAERVAAVRDGAFIDESEYMHVINGDDLSTGVLEPQFSRELPTTEGLLGDWPVINGDDEPRGDR